MTSDAAPAPRPAYRAYWIAWGVLLVVTLAMMGLASRAVLLAGVTLKAGVILFWFMHLRHERAALSAAVLAAIFATGLLLFGLLVPDGLAM